MAGTTNQTLKPEPQQSTPNAQPAASDSSKISDETPTDISLKERHNAEFAEDSKPADLETAQNGEKKEEEPKPQAQPRSKLKIALIMLSLCVSMQATHTCTGFSNGAFRLPSSSLLLTRCVHMSSHSHLGRPYTYRLETDNHHDCRTHNRSTLQNLRSRLCLDRFHLPACRCCFWSNMG